MIKAVIVDFDDTLSMTEQACFVMENEALRAIGQAPMSREIHIQTWGKPLFDAIQERSPGVDVTKFKATFHPIMQRHLKLGNLDTIAPENYQVLRELADQGKQIMLLTSRTHDEIKHMLEPNHLLSSHVEAFYYRENTQYHKPDPRVFDALLDKHSLRPKDCVYVGDSVSDAAASQGAGIRCIISLESGLRTKEQFSMYAVDAFINAFSELPTVIHTLEHDR